MSKHKNYSEFYNKKDEVPAEEPVTEAPVKEEVVFETEVTPTEIIQKPVAIVKGAKKVNLRQKPNTECEVLKVVTEDTAVKILDTSNYSWWKIEVDDQVGYMMSQYLKRI